MLNKQISFFILILLSTGLLSCNTTKKIVYFQTDTTKYEYAKKVVLNEPVVQSSDILGITVISLNEEFNKLFEAPLAGGLRYTSFPGGQSGSQGIQPLGYEVDSLGFVDVPLVGKIRLSGFTLSQASDTIRFRLNNYLKNPSVNIRFLNHKFTILGEVNKPSTYNLLENNLTIIEAIGMAGDMTIYGKRDNVMLVRNVDGIKQILRINLLSSNILNDSSFYLKNGDIIYVEPSEVKTTYNDRTYQILPIATSIIAAVTSLGVLLLNITR